MDSLRDDILLRSMLFIMTMCLICAVKVTTSDPRQTIQSLIDAVKELSLKGEDNPDPGLVKKISGVMDIGGISKACLSSYWKKLSPEEQKDFVSLFRDVLEKVAYPKSAKFFKDTEVDIEEVTIENDNAHVITVVSHPEEGLVEVEYVLKSFGGAWLIEDVILDGVSLLQDLRAQMQKIIKEKSYQELKRRLREKLEE